MAISAPTQPFRQDLSISSVTDFNITVVGLIFWYRITGCRIRERAYVGMSAYCIGGVLGETLAEGSIPIFGKFSNVAIV